MPIRPVILDAETIASAPTEGFSDPSIDGGNVTWKTLLSRGKTPTTTFTAGIATCAAPGGHLKCHRHVQAEIYYVLRGRGSMVIDGEEYGVREGSVVFVPGDAEHGIWNVGEGELAWLYVFAAERFEDVVYRFGGGVKLGPKL
ncbi:RmlC-like cupin [Polyplosphaeria fusca]|uniref:RmlC-like cupin n=1 Tax=Polyplosphaeria fusca TaxID=682080 RepID=A0A9P4R6M1_9PLEO|nr:RmlC-like cupin [Polyplosphaeria fusca]